MELGIERWPPALTRDLYAELTAIELRGRRLSASRRAAFAGFVLRLFGMMPARPKPVKA